MKCPTCKSETKVYDSRPTESGKYRRRECLKCGAKFTTMEVLKHSPAAGRISITVEQFNRMKRAATAFGKVQAAIADGA